VDNNAYTLGTIFIKNEVRVSASLYSFLIYLKIFRTHYISLWREQEKIPASMTKLTLYGLWNKFSQYTYLVSHMLIIISNKFGPI